MRLSSPVWSPETARTGRSKGARMRLIRMRFAAALLVSMAVGCASSNERKVLTEQQLEEMRKADLAELAVERQTTMDEIVERLGREDDDFKAGRRAIPPEFDLLAISGGGDFGAFAAGVLVGWGQ